jgi:1-acyl-sn-glycerol-3-phosphate acyltransferase
MRIKKTVYYHDLLNDDFSVAQIKEKPLPKHFKYLHKNVVYYVLSCLIYYVFAIPILWTFAKIKWSFRIVGKKKFRKAHLLNHGCFIYGNHTCAGDAMFCPTEITNPRKCYIVCGRAAVSLSAVRWLEMMIGTLPLPDSPERTKDFIEAINYHYSHGNAIVIFPEAHIWDYCTRIRPFPDQSFTYPAQNNAAVFAMCTTYEEHKFFKFRKPRPVIHISDPIYPDMSKPLGERTHLLREAVYSYMVDISSSFDNVEYIRYLPAKDEKIPASKK